MQSAGLKRMFQGRWNDRMLLYNECGDGETPVSRCTHSKLKVWGLFGDSSSSTIRLGKPFPGATRVTSPRQTSTVRERQPAGLAVPKSTLKAKEGAQDEKKPRTFRWRGKRGRGMSWTRKPRERKGERQLRRTEALQAPCSLPDSRARHHHSWHGGPASPFLPLPAQTAHEPTPFGSELAKRAPLTN